MYSMFKIPLSICRISRPIYALKHCKLININANTSKTRSLSYTTRNHDNNNSLSDTLLTKTLTSNKSFTDNEFIRCTIFDKRGDIVIHGKEIKRLQFMKSHNLVLRDFRKISRHYHSQNSSQGSINTAINVDIVPSIVTRSDCILLNLLNIRALIRSDTVVIFDSFSSSTGSGLNESNSHSMFLQQMHERLRSDSDENLPYEFKALEAILIHVITNLNTEMKVHTTVLQNILNGLEKSIERVKLRYLLIQSKKITQFHQKATLIRDLFDDILEQDDELNALYLTEIQNNSPRVQTNHTEVEMLLESYLKTCDEIVQTVENLKSQIKTSEEIINIVLDSNRNELMLLGLKFSIGLLSMAVALYIGALYGMNLENFIEESDGGFEVICAIGTILIFILFGFSMKELKKLQKITMSGVGREEMRKPIKMRP